MGRLVLTLLLVCAGLMNAANAASLRAPDNAEISPKLSPASHDKFFDKDYPADKRPPAAPEATGDKPYPNLKDVRGTDENFLKDENQDGEASEEDVAMRTKEQEE